MNTPHQDDPGGVVFSVCGQIYGQREIIHNGQVKNVTEIEDVEGLSETFIAANQAATAAMYSLIPLKI